VIVPVGRPLLLTRSLAPLISTALVVEINLF
jgi:hypothetical protein